MLSPIRLRAVSKAISKTSLLTPALCRRTPALFPLTKASFSTTPFKMSFSNTDTGSKNADPYTEKNHENAALKDKVEDLVQFIEKCKFCMMATRIADSGLIVSRCMALAAKVCRVKFAPNLIPD